MRESATPTRDAPLRRLAFLGLVFVATILSCAKDVTGPNSGRFMRGFSWNTVYPGPLRDVGSAGTGLVPFTRVRVLLHHSDGTVALDTTIAFPSTADSLTVSLNVKLLSDAPASGEAMTADLGYINAAGDTVFKGGPIALTAAPAPAGGGTNPPVQVPVTYTGPGATATSVAITPHTSTVAASAGFTLAAIAKDASANALAGTPVVWTSLDTTIATITAPGAGTGLAKTIRGTARIVAQLLTGAADTAQLTVTLPASQVVKPAAANGDAQTGTAGTALAQPIVAKVAASDGVGVAGTTVTFAVATGGGSVTPLTAVSDANGLAQTTWTLGTGTGAQSITAGVATLTGSPLTYTATATAGAATKLVVTTQPLNASGGQLLATTVTAEDANGNVATTFTGAITMALGTTTSGAVLSGTATVNAVAGVATFTTLTINKAFTGYTLIASAGSLITPATTTAFNVTVGLATSISTVGGNAQTGSAGVALPTPIAVRVVDAGGNGVSGKTVTFATTDGSVTPSSIATDVNGLAITTWTLGSTVGAQSMTATAAGLTNSPLAITATGTAVAASKLVFTTVPVTATGGVPLPALAVTAEDANGNIATTFTGSVTLALGNTTSGAVLSGTATVAAVAGVATFSTLSINKAFTGYTLVASATGPTSATSPAFDITIGAATTITTAGGTGQTGTISLALPTPIAVRVTDLGGNGVSGKTITFATTNGSVSPTSAVSDASGVAITTWTLGATIGAQSMTATSAGLTGSPLTITATGTAVVAGPATQLSFSTQPSNVAAGASIAPAMVVHALDANGLLATSFSGTVTLTIGTNPGGSALGGALSLPAVAGVATFSNAVMSKVGTGYTLVASSGTLTSGTSSTFNVAPGAAANIAISAGNNQTATPGTAVPTAPGVTVTDALANAVPGVSVTFTVASGGGSVSPSSGSTSTNAAGQAFLTSWTLGTTAGSQTLVATSTGLTGSPVTFTATATVLGLKTWTGATSTAWATASNWSPSGAPASTDSVFVPVVTNLPTIASSVTIKSLSLAPSAALFLNGAPLTITGSLDATGGITGTGGVTLSSATGATIKGTLAQTITVQGLYTVTGTLAAGGLQINSGSLDLNGQAVAIATGGIGTAGTGTIVMNQAGSTLTTTGGAGFGGGDETGKLTAGTLSVGGNFTEGGGSSTEFNAGTAHTLILNGSVAASLTMTNPTTSIIGNLIINNAAGVSAPAGFIANNVTITSGVLSGTAGATINGTLTDPLAHWSAGNIIFATSTTPVSATTPSITPATTVTFANNPSTLAANLTINGTVNVGGNLVPNGHTLTINGAFATIGANGQLTMTNSADVVSATGNVTFGASGTGGLMSAGTLSIGGNFMQSGGAQSINTSGTNTVVFNGTVAQTVIFSSPDGNFAGGACVGDACFQNLTSSKSSGALNFLTTTKVQGNFTNSNSGSATIQTPVSNGAFIIAGNALFGQGGTYYKTGVGGSGFSKGAGTVIDSVYYFGGGQAYNPATLGESFTDIRGTSSWTSPGTLTGSMIVDGNGQLNVTNGAAAAVVTGNFTTSGSGTLKMTTNATDSLVIGGNAAFGGGATTGLLTTGNIVVGGSSVTNTGLAFDASGAQTTTFNAATGAQSLIWLSPVAGKGYNNVTMKGAAVKQFSGDQYINGTLLFDPAMTGAVSGSYNIYVNNLADNSPIVGGGWSGSTTLHLTGNGGTLPTKLGVNTVYFEGGGNVILNQNLTTNYMVVDQGTGLVLNGHTVNLQGNYFTTQNGGFLVMQSATDSLVANQLFFNGGSTVGALTQGVIDVAGPVFGVLYQGYSSGHVAVPSASTTAFAASGTQVRFNPSFGANVAFANPGTGGAGSHFGFVQATNGAPITLQSDVFVDSLLMGDAPSDVWNSDAPGTTVRTITTKGIYNSGTYGLALNGVSVVLNDGPAASTFFNSVTWTGFPASYNGTLLTVNRSVSAPQINFNTFSVTLGAGGEYINNLGSISLTLGLSNVGGCALSLLGIGGHCP